jgi:S-DNA-T family DNA segregation ATPase FtsK/SpoIIIE
VGVWWCVKGAARLVYLYLRYWYATAPATGLAWLWHRYGRLGPVVPLSVLTAGGLSWWLTHRASFQRWVWWPVLGRCRLARYRRGWHAAMATAKLAVSFDGTTVLPTLLRVRHRAGTDALTVRMVTGQIPDDYGRVAERLAHTFGARAVKAVPGRRPDLVTLLAARADALASLVAPLPVPAVPDFTALPLGLCEDGRPYTLCLFGTQVLIVGATGAGKGSVIWSLVRALAGGIGTGLVQLWGLDPKGGMELGLGLPLFTRFASRDFAEMATMLEEAAGTAQARAALLSGRTRQHTPTVAEPLVVLVIDELANLTAYLTDRHLKDRIKAALSVLLSQGRAVGVHVVAAIQDPRKEVLPFRDLFPTRIGLRLSEEPQVDLVLGEGTRDRGALCDRIPRSQPGIGYVVIDGDPTPMRVRFSFLTDEDIRAMARSYGRLRTVDAPGRRPAGGPAPVGGAA